jgi:hypothetical protein
MSTALGAQRRPRTRLLVGLSVLGGLVLFAGANAHLLYVALTSQPDCVDHVRERDASGGAFRAAKSACSPAGPGVRP